MHSLRLSRVSKAAIRAARRSRAGRTLRGAVLVGMCLGAPVATARAASSVYVVNNGDGTVSQFNRAGGGALSPLVPAATASGTSPQGVVISPDAKHVYVTDYLDGRVSQYDVDAGGRLSPRTPPSILAGAGASG